MDAGEPSEQPTLSLTVEEFLHVRRQLAADHTQDTLLTKLDEEILLIARSDPDRALEILTALTASQYRDDRDAAAIYVGALFTTRHEQVKQLLAKLLQDPDEEISEKAFETLEEITEHGTITTGEATQLLHTYYVAHPVTQSSDT